MYERTESVFSSNIVLCEAGAGHAAMGSIVGAGNAARVANSWLGAKMVLVANGGWGCHASRKRR